MGPKHTKSPHHAFPGTPTLRHSDTFLSTSLPSDSSDWTLDAVKLIWIRQSSCLIRLLSRTVVREVCTYLPTRMEVISICEGNVILRNVSDGGKRLVELSGRVEMNTTCVPVMLYTKLFIVCAGLSAKKTFEISVSGEVTELTECLFEHFHPGVVQISSKSRIYVFGGNVSTCETLKLPTRRWSSLPSLTYPRSYFHPCVYCQTVYLCGGFTTAIELFHVGLNRFLSPIQYELPESSDCLAIAKDDKVIIVLQHFTCVWDIKARSTSAVRTQGLSPWSLPSHFIVLGSSLYFEVPGGGIVEGDLLSGDFTRKRETWVSPRATY